MPHFKIPSRYDPSRIIYEGEANTLADLVGTAVRSRANLTGADLAGANLTGADLAGANLADAYLAGANLADAYLARAYLAGADLARANLARANLARANLTGANLTGAYLAGANLTGAYLARADLTGANGEKLTLVGDRPILQIGPLGSEGRYLLRVLTDRGLYFKACCWGWGTAEAFRTRLDSVYPVGTCHGDEYRAAVVFAETHARLWAPKTETAKTPMGPRRDASGRFVKRED
jgi:hypothetical protein